MPHFLHFQRHWEGVEKLKEFMSMLNSRIMISGLFKKPSDPVEFLIDGIYQVTGVGLVIAGTLREAQLSPTRPCSLGLTKQAAQAKFVVKSIHHKRRP